MAIVHEGFDRHAVFGDLQKEVLLPFVLLQKVVPFWLNKELVLFEARRILFAEEEEVVRLETLAAVKGVENQLSFVSDEVHLLVFLLEAFNVCRKEGDECLLLRRSEIVVEDEPVLVGEVDFPFRTDGLGILGNPFTFAMRVGNVQGFRLEYLVEVRAGEFPGPDVGFLDGGNLRANLTQDAKAGGEDDV